MSSPIFVQTLKSSPTIRQSLRLSCSSSLYMRLPILPIEPSHKQAHFGSLLKRKAIIREIYLASFLPESQETAQ